MLKVKGKARAMCLYLLEDADHVGVLAHGQTQRHGQSLLVLKAAGVELGPELHLQLAIFLLRKLKLRHTALQLQDGREDSQRTARLKSAPLHLPALKTSGRRNQNKLPHSLQPLSPPFSELPRTGRSPSLSLCGRSERHECDVTAQQRAPELHQVNHTTAASSHLQGFNDG